MVPYILYTINTILAFRLILQMNFRKNIWSIIGGILMIVAGFIISNYEMEIPYHFVDVLLSFMPLFFFQGTVFKNIIWGAFLRAFITLFHRIIYGIMLVIYGLDAYDLPISIISNSLMLILIGATVITLKKKKYDMKLILEKFNVAILLPFIISFVVLQLDSGFSGELDENSVAKVYGINMVRNGIIGVAVMCICIMIITVIWQRRQMQREIILKERCIEEQVKQYKLLKERDESIRKFKHDYNNHLNVINQLINNGEYAKLDKYIKSLGEFHGTVRYITTNNLISDAIVNQYYVKCINEKIAMTVVGMFPDTTDISETDLCVLLSNGFENAYEAAVMCTGKRYINIEIKYFQETIFIIIENSSTTKPQIKSGVPITTKTDTTSHGYGTQNMLEVVKKNKGEINWEALSDDVVRTNIRLK